MNKDDTKVGDKALVEVEIRKLAGKNVHIMIGNKVVSVAASTLK